MTDQQKKAVAEASERSASDRYTEQAWEPSHEDHVFILKHERAFELGEKEVLNNPKKYNLVDADVYIEAVEGRRSFRESLRIERLESNRLAKENAQLKDVLSGLVTDVGGLLGQHDIEWQQAGYFNEAKELLKGGDTCKP